MKWIIIAFTVMLILNAILILFFRKCDCENKGKKNKNKY